jgi:hypothetical protein
MPLSLPTDCFAFAVQPGCLLLYGLVVCNTSTRKVVAPFLLCSFEVNISSVFAKVLPEIKICKIRVSLLLTRTGQSEPLGEDRSQELARLSEPRLFHRSLFQHSPDQMPTAQMAPLVSLLILRV